MSDQRFDGKSGRTPSAQARRYIHAYPVNTQGVM